MLITAVFFLTIAVSALISLWFITNAGKLGFMDIPNARSSHNLPTPLGGGAGIVAAMAAGFGVCYVAGAVEINVKYLSVIAGFFAMALLGFFSDRFNISAIIRIILQAAIAVVMVWRVGCPASFYIAGFDMRTGCICACFAVLWIVAITNFYNFMDGIDGLAAMQGLIAGAGIAIFGAIIGNRSVIPMGLILSGASAGFLILNFPPARIFMGDTGSYSLGLYIASFGLIDKRLFIPVTMVLGVFIFDSAVTLVKRLVNGEEWYNAHRSHFYQRALKLGYSHRQVTSAVSVIIAILTAMAAAYIKAPPLLQIVILVSAAAVVTSAAVWLVFKERSREKAPIC